MNRKAATGLMNSSFDDDMGAIPLLRTFMTRVNRSDSMNKNNAENENKKCYY
jgi:hypothetical protein